MCTGFRGAVRLADGEVGDGYEYGRLEVFANGTWGAVCDISPFTVPGFTTKSALVACTSLGYGGGAPLRFLQPRFLRFIQGENAVWHSLYSCVLEHNRICLCQSVHPLVDLCIVPAGHMPLVVTKE